MHDGILIWGAGAIGGTLGAYLIRAGQDVTFVDVVPEHVAAINDERPQHRRARSTRSPSRQKPFFPPI